MKKSNQDESGINPIAFNVTTLAKLVQISRSTILKETYSGRLKYIVMRRDKKNTRARRLYTMPDVQDWLASYRESANG